MAHIGRERRSRGGDGSASMLFALVPLLAGASILFFVLYHLLQPTVLRNPGLAAYTAPVGTRTIALPTSGEEPVYQPPTPSTAFAEASATPSEPAARASVHKRPRSRRAASHEHEDRQPSFGQQAIFGYRGGPRFSF